MIYSTLFSSVLVIIIMNAFTTNTLVYALPVLLCSYGTIRYCAFSESKNPKLYYTPVFFFVCLFGVSLTNLTTSDISFSFWMFYNISEAIAPPVYYVATFILGCFLIPSVVYYFTLVRCRPVYLLLITFVAFLFNDRREIDVPAVLIALCAAFLICVIFIHAHNFGGKPLNYSRRHILSVTFLVFAVSLPFAYTNNPDDQAARNPLNRAFSSISGLMSYSERSGLADTRFLDERIIFEVEAAMPVYLMRQVYDLYDGEQWYVTRGPLNASYTNWQEGASSRDYDILLSKIRLAKAAGKLEDIYLPDDMWQVEYPLNARITPVSGLAAQYYPAPLRTFYMDSLGISAKNGKDEIFSQERYGNSQFYNISYFTETFRTNGLLQNFAAQFDLSSFDLLLSELMTLEPSNEPPLTLISFKTTLVEASWYQELWHSVIQSGRDAPVFYSQDLQRLTEEIIKDAKTDYEKAYRLEQYFRESGFVYDLNFPSEINSDIEHFIFNVKRGICGHYATSMTIMARMAGLNARYVEGFYSTERDRRGTFIVRAKHAHAFVQVFIPAYGWVTFDPTVPSDGTDGGGIGGFIGSIAAIIFYWLSIAALCFFAFFLFLLPVIKARAFKRSLKNKDAVQGIIMIFARIRRILAQNTSAGINTPALALDDFVFKNYGLNITSAARNYNLAAFAYAKAKEQLTKTDLEQAYLEYAALYKRLNRPSLRLRRLLQS